MRSIFEDAELWVAGARLAEEALAAAEDLTPDIVVANADAGESEDPSATQRTCPGCGTPLEWIEEGTIGLRTYEYYRWCLKGCGLYCFDRHGAAWIKLA
jgi:hypothetical protein